MIRKLSFRVFPVFIALALMASDDEPWRGKQIAEWSEDDAKQVLADSPWAKSFTPTLNPSQQQQRSGGMGPRMGGGGIGMGGIGIGIPGMGGRRMGGGFPGGNGNPNGNGNDQGSDRSVTEAPKLTLRWASAMPVRTAELRVRDNDAPILDDRHYAIAVYGIPDRLIEGDAEKLANQYKKDAAIKRDGKKDFKPSSVQVIDGRDGRVVVYMFPTTNEITKQDHRVEFNAKIGRLELNQSFFVEDMVWQGKLEL